MAVDGKTSRGARRADGTRGCLLGAAGHGGRLLDHLEVGDGHNETSHFIELLGSVDLAGAVVTFDALHTVRANLDWLVTDKKAHYIAIVKRNQPLLHARVRALPWRQVPAGGITRDTGHGRAETRTLKTAHVSRLDFPGARQAIGAPPRDVTFGEDTSAARTGSGPVNLATIRAAIIAAIKDAGYLHIPEGRRDHTTPAETLRLHGLD